MIIKDSQVELYSQSQNISKQSISQSTKKFYAETNSNDIKNTKEAFQLNFQYEYSSTYTQSSRAVYNYEEDLSPEDRIKKLIIEMLLEQFSNQKISLYPQKMLNTNKENSTTNFPNNFFKNPYTNELNNDGKLKAIVFETTEEYYAKQSIDFSAKVKFNTPNKSYEMNLDISFSKEFYESTNTRIVIGDEAFIDPLIINFGEDINPFENISSLKFAFDLNSDEQAEMIPYLKSGAGYLALDKNNNGTIDNGSELFGPQTNDGFKELAKYDNDKNGFIDEADEVFNKLKIWSIDESGNSSLISLLDANVGAIYLGDIQSGFVYKDSIFNTQAIQKSNGIFIKEDGSGLGVVNSIDIVV
ncbi:hypothetical protein [Arcobacter lacus]|uniref:Uncharacterized protein n=1 Tax=Arcobacter lacus TaxID=1912876 RepID=A0ABX5JQJ4_9BACT|nr:hypothetical protein [Arcobacter lacus]PUE67570.1 hypothetical protein B0175_00875 [Arcobacter lacus]